MIPFTILRAHFFTEQFQLMGVGIRHGELRLPVNKLARVAPISFADFSAAVCTVASELYGAGISAGGRFRDQTFLLTGPKLMSPLDVEESISSALGRRVFVKQVSDAEFAALLKDEGVSEEFWPDILKLFKSFENDQFKVVSHDFEQIVGSPASSVEVRVAIAILRFPRCTFGITDGICLRPFVISLLCFNRIGSGSTRTIFARCHPCRQLCRSLCSKRQLGTARMFAPVAPLRPAKRCFWNPSRLQRTTKE
jgi:hypothetical protein